MKSRPLPRTLNLTPSCGAVASAWLVFQPGHVGPPAFGWLHRDGDHDRDDGRGVDRPAVPAAPGEFHHS